jgi:hypothetical protein
MNKTFQPMPELSDEQYAALRQDIEANGVIVPIVVDQHGRTLDGHNRQRIAADLGIDCPVEVREVADDNEAMDLALTLNCARRHLTREQVREVIRGEIQRRPQDSDRAIAKRVGCSPSTVGAVRKPAAEVSNLDTPAMTRKEAEKTIEEIRDAVMQARGALYALVGQALTNHIPQVEVLGALTMARLRFAKRTDHSELGLQFYLEQVFDFILEVTSWNETVKQFPPHPDSDPTPDERAMLIEHIVMMGDQHHPADSPRTIEV